MRRSVSILVGLLLVAACSDGRDEREPQPDTATASPRHELVRFRDCASLLSYMKREASLRVSQRGGLPGGFPVAHAQSPPPDTPIGQPARTFDPFPPVKRPHRAGEPDVIQRRGDLLISVDPGDGLHAHLAVLRAESGTLRPLGRIDLPAGTTSDSGLLVSADRVFVVTNVHQLPTGSQVRLPMLPHVIVSIVDIRDPTALRLSSVLHLDGTAVSARVVGSSVRMIHRGTGDLGLANPIVGSPPGPIPPTRLRAAVAKSKVGNWLPRFTIADGSDRTVQRGVVEGCARTYRASTFSGFPVTSVLTIGALRALPRVDAAIIGDAGVVESSGRSLDVVVEPWAGVKPPSRGSGAASALRLPTDVRTEIHRFDLSAGGDARYIASTTIADTLLDPPEALSERDGRLRAATTDPLAELDEPAGVARNVPSETSHIRTFATRGRELVEVGDLADIGKGAPVSGVRFFGDRAIVHTSRPSAHLVDLRDSERPVLGPQLPLPGYVNVFPIDASLMLAIDSYSNGSERGTMIVLFDAGDPRRLRVLARKKVPGFQVSRDTSSYAWVAGEKLFLAPFSGEISDDAGSGTQLFGFRIDRRAGISEVGRRFHPDLETGLLGELRSGAIGSTVYAASPNGILVTDLTFKTQRWVDT